MQSWEWRRGMRTASACENGTARCETVCSPSSCIPMRRRTTTAVSGNCGRQPPIARSRAGSAHAGAPICSLPFDPLSVPQHDVDLMRIRQFVLSCMANLSFYQVEQLRHLGLGAGLAAAALWNAMAAAGQLFGALNIIYC